MTVPPIQSTSCSCPPGFCEQSFGQDDHGSCINRLEGGARVLPCDVCGAHTWHANVTGACMRCTAMPGGKPAQPKRFISPEPLPTKREQEMLTIAMEEGFEVLEELHKVLTGFGQRASKAIRFGLNEIQPGQTLTNRERLSTEAGQIVAVIMLLVNEGTLDQEIVDKAATTKTSALETYMQHNRDAIPDR